MGTNGLVGYWVLIPTPTRNNVAKFWVMRLYAPPPSLASPPPCPPLHDHLPAAAVCLIIILFFGKNAAAAAAVFAAVFISFVSSLFLPESSYNIVIIIHS